MLGRILPGRTLVGVALALAMLAAGCASGSDGDTTVSASEATSSTASDSGSTSESAAPDDDAAASDDADTGNDGGDTDDAASEGGDSDADSGEAAGDATDAGDSGDGEDTPMAADSPIGAFFSDDGGFEAAIDEYRARVNEAIVRCMAAQGFEFAADSTTGGNSVQQAQNEMTEREWTTEFGYGISTSFDSIAENRRTDPNAGIVLSLSPGEREAWLDTLLGVDREGFAVGDIGAKPLEEQGCIGAGIIETGGEGAIQGLDEFGDAYDEGEQALFDRTEMITAVDAWSQCMAGAGYTGYAAVDDPETDISDRLAVITAPMTAALDEIDEEEARALIDGTNDGLSRLPGLDVDALRSLQAEEREVAVVDLDCYDEHVRATYEPLRDDFERGLMETYASQLDALKNIGQ